MLIILGVSVSRIFTVAAFCYCPSSCLDVLGFLFRSGPEVIKLFLCSTQLGMKFFSLIHVKMPTIVGILTCMSGKNSILGLTEPEKKPNFLIFLYL